jgi:hypothetical protein
MYLRNIAFFLRENFDLMPAVDKPGYLVQNKSLSQHWKPA